MSFGDNPNTRNINSFNIIAHCRQYGLPIWQCPQFLFVIMGFIIIATALSLYLIGMHYFIDPEIVLFIVLSVTGILFVVAYVITTGFERLAEISKMKSDFIDIVSHQMRSPLTSIKWGFEFLSSKNAKISRQKKEEYFENIKENIARMIELVDDLLIVSKIEQGKFPISSRMISPKKIIEKLISRFKVFADAADIKVFFSCSKDAEIEIFTDPSLLKLVIENLIDNALHYTNGGGKVEISLQVKNKKLLFKIKDSGIGIPASEKRYIFQKFFRAKNALRKVTRGNGLGLYLCKTIIEKLGGKIWFESEENKGTTFYFTLPIKQ